MSNDGVAGVRSLAFDVFGTVVDWRGTIAREGAMLSAAKGLALDWEALADAWRLLYRPTMDRVTRGELPWTPFDALQRLMLDEVLAQAGNGGLDDEERAHLTAVWERLDPWPDVQSSLTRLKQRYVLATLSNGSVRQLVGIARHGYLPWDLILSVEMFRVYKPDPRVYRGAIDFLQCHPEEMMMVAAHVYDLRAARDVGLRTAFVARPREWGERGAAEVPEPGEFDLTATDFADLARQLSC